MTALKLMSAVGAVLGVVALAWTKESAAKDEAVAMVRKMAALLRREGVAFTRFIGEDASRIPDGASERQSATAAPAAEAWQVKRLRESAGSSV